MHLFCQHSTNKIRHIIQFPLVIAPFYATTDVAFSFQMFVLHFSVQLFTLRSLLRLCPFQTKTPCFPFAPVGKRGLILSTPGASGLRHPTTPLPVYAGCYYVKQVCNKICMCLCVSVYVSYK